MLKSMRNCVQVILLDWRTDKANDNFKKINRMKKFITLMILSAICLGAKAQYQLANSDFEEWEEVKYKKNFLTTLTGYEPVSWSSFLDATGSWKSQCNIQLYKDENVREGASGNFCAKLTCSSIFSIVAQGNLTNGCINMGSTTADDATGNYNYINDGTAGQAMMFTGKPDAMTIWVNFHAGNSGFANVSTILCTKGYYQDPLANENNGKTWGSKVATAQNNQIIGEDTWVQYTIPFEYANKDLNPYYALVSISTAASPGDSKKHANDVLYVDDIEMVYNSELTGAKYDGKDVIFENGHAIVPAIYESEKLNLTSNGQGASIYRNYDEETALLTITVSGNNITEDPQNKHVYTIQFYNASATLAVNSAAHYGTFCAPFDVTIPVGVQAFTISGIDKNGILTLEQQNTISAHTPVIVYSESASDINAVQFGVATSGTATSDYLKGVYDDTTAPVGSYVLQNQRGRVGFYQVQEGIQPMVRANRAYLTVPASANVKAFYMDDATAIQTVEELLSGKAEIYDLAGRRQQKLQKGINIVGGKKVLVK